ncbi:MAG TPA: HD domain-containing phosphohydrolase [Candidatus Acidoferrum sp.]|nr:HD domain-containing phosphohydrolase [Candidatus Acidoferrum sp.]
MSRSAAPDVSTAVNSENRNLQETKPAIRVSELISALSYALDITEGRPMGHAVRSCLLGMRIAEELGLPAEAQADLYYTLLLKDAGCSSNSSRLYHILNADDIRAKGDVKTTDWTEVGWESLHYAITHVATEMPFAERVWRLIQVAATQQRDSCELVKIRCERGSSIARKLGFSENVAAGIHSLDEHWNGKGYPNGLRKKDIPLASNIANLAQTLEVFWAAKGPEAAIEAAEARSGRWFDPELVKAANSLAKQGRLWSGLESEEVITEVMGQEPQERRLTANEESIDTICLAFADIIDAKTPFTFQHSNGVADAAVLIAHALGMPEREVNTLRRAALLHDIGKLGVSNTILEKPGKLTAEEFAEVRKHPFFTYEILRRIPAFADFSMDAAAHHERLDGRGYWRGISGDQMSLPARILAVADVFDALSAKRPYRDALPLEKVFSIMREDAPHALDWPCLSALMEAKQH